MHFKQVLFSIRENNLVLFALGTARLLRPGGGEGGVVLEGEYNFKTFLGGKFFTGKKHEGGQILWHSNSSLGNLKSVI